MPAKNAMISIQRSLASLIAQHDQHGRTDDSEKKQDRIQRTPDV
jgi:hypothetical protein